VPILAPADSGRTLQQVTIFGGQLGRTTIRIVFAQAASGLLQIAAAGGTVTELTKPNSERREFSHRLPHVLSGADAVLFTVHAQSVSPMGGNAGLGALSQFRAVQTIDPRAAPTRDTSRAVIFCKSYIA
jgi:hypothetical protein